MNCRDSWTTVIHTSDVVFTRVLHFPVCHLCDGYLTKQSSLPCANISLATMSRPKPSTIAAMNWSIVNVACLNNNKNILLYICLSPLYTSLHNSVFTTTSCGQPLQSLMLADMLAVFGYCHHRQDTRTQFFLAGRQICSKLHSFVIRHALETRNVVANTWRILHWRKADGASPASIFFFQCFCCVIWLS